MGNKLFSFFLGSELQNRFVIFFIMLASLPLLVLGSLSISLIDLSHRQDVSNLENQILDQKIEELRKFLGEALGVIDIKLGVTQAREIETSEGIWQELLIDGILSANPAFEEVSFSDMQGRERAKRSRLVANPELANIRELNYFKEALAGRAYLGEVNYTINGPVAFISSPVRVGEIIVQVVAARVDLSSVVRSVELGRLGSSGYLLLLDQEGILIAPRQKGGVVHGTNFSFLKNFLQRESIDDFRGVHRYKSIFDGVPVVSMSKPISPYGWTIAAEWPMVDADALIADVRNQVIRLTIFSILAVLILAPFFARRLLQPIRALEEVTEEIEKGNFEKRVEIKTRDEMEELGEAFNKMVQGLKRLQELKNEFVYIAAHELRSPVTVVKGYISLIMEEMGTNISVAVKHDLDVVMQANERLVKLINDILEIARSEAGRLKVEVSEVNMGEVVRQILIEAKMLADPKKVLLIYVEEKDFRVLADSGKLKEILMNFISNAIKYNREGGWVKIYYVLEGKNLITHIEDNGLGMSEKDQKHMFEKFFRSEQGTVKAIQGTGLGLFITKELVEKMGGKVWSLSREGRGTRFSFSLPLV